MFLDEWFRDLKYIHIVMQPSQTFMSIFFKLPILNLSNHTCKYPFSPPRSQTSVFYFSFLLMWACCFLCTWNHLRFDSVWLAHKLCTYLAFCFAFPHVVAYGRIHFCLRLNVALGCTPFVYLFVHRRTLGLFLSFGYQLC